MQVTAAVASFLSYDTFGSAKAFTDQAILNPPVTSQAGAIWSQSQNTLKEWSLSVSFRVNGPEHGGKGMAIWYTAGIDSPFCLHSVWCSFI